MKKPYLENGDDYESDESSSSGTQETPETEPHSKASLQRSQSSIADNNGSPVKNSPLGDAMPHNVHLAELPKTSSPASTNPSNGQPPTKQQQRKNSLETIVERKTRTQPAAATAEPRRMNDFPDDSQGKAGDENPNEKSLQKENLPTVAHNKQPILASSKSLMAKRFQLKAHWVVNLLRMVALPSTMPSRTMTMTMKKQIPPFALYFRIPTLPLSKNQNCSR